MSNNNNASTGSDNENIFEVEFICAVRYNYDLGKCEYYAKFKNEPTSANWWISNTDNCKDLVIQFWEQMHIQRVMNKSNNNVPKKGIKRAITLEPLIRL